MTHAMCSRSGKQLVRLNMFSVGTWNCAFHRFFLLRIEPGTVRLPASSSAIWWNIHALECQAASSRARLGLGLAPHQSPANSSREFFLRRSNLKPLFPARCRARGSPAQAFERTYCLAG